MEPQEVPAPPEAPLDPQARVSNALTVTQQGERTICEVKRHPIGILGIYVTMGLLLIVVAVLALVVAPNVISSDLTLKVGGLVFLVVTLFVLAFVYISAKVYWGNSWVITTDSLTQIEQDSLFDRKSSQLSLGNLEDVTAEQNGILPHMFNYGLLRVETASERGKFTFPYCPNPNYYAQQILSARESFEQHRRGEDLQRPYRAQSAYANPASNSNPISTTSPASSSSTAAPSESND